MKVFTLGIYSLTGATGNPIVEMDFESREIRRSCRKQRSDVRRHADDVKKMILCLDI